MVYILAPYSLSLNTTSRNRILSFYRAFKNKQIEVAIISPPLLVNLSTWYHQNGEDNSDLNIIYLPGGKSGLLKLIASKTGRRFKSLFFIFNSLLSPLLTSKVFENSGKKKPPIFSQLQLSSEDVVICSYPSPVSMAIANRLVDTYGCQLVLDYRDPWTYGYDLVDVPKLASYMKKRMERGFENLLLKKAAMVTVISEKLGDYFPQSVKHKIAVIKNGSNAYHINPDEISSMCDKLRIVYLGRIYNQQLEDESFFRSISQFIKKREIDPDLLEMVFVGPNNENLLKVLNKYDLSRFVTIYPTISIDEAMKIGYTASAFLHLRYGDADAIYTSKHADYQALQKPILLPASDHGVLAESIIKDNAGYVSSKPEEFTGVLEKLWSKFKNGESFKLERSEEYLYNISREAEAEKLVQLLLRKRQHSETLVMQKAI